MRKELEDEIAGYFDEVVFAYRRCLSAGEVLVASYSALFQYSSGAEDLAASSTEKTQGQQTISTLSRTADTIASNSAIYYKSVVNDATKLHMTWRAALDLACSPRPLASLDSATQDPEAAIFEASTGTPEIAVATKVLKWLKDDEESKKVILRLAGLLRSEGLERLYVVNQSQIRAALVYHEVIDRPLRHLGSEDEMAVFDLLSGPLSRFPKFFDDGRGSDTFYDDQDGD